MEPVHQHFSSMPPDTGLYRFAHEHDACGVGLVASLDNRPSRRIVQLGVEALKRLMHRGAAGADPETGDGAGMLLPLPDAFFRKTLDFSLPAPGKYAVAMLFAEGDPDGGCPGEVEDAIRAAGLATLGRRAVPVNPDAVGAAARRSRPGIWQIFVDAGDLDKEAFDRRLYVVRRKIEKRRDDIVFCSFSRTAIVYKGLLMASQLDAFYPDISDPDFVAALAVVHQRYSTNTFPTWRLAHPFRYLAHNGEINTIRGNLNHLQAREIMLQSELFGESLRDCLPLMDGGESDSAALDRMLELLVLSGRSLPHAMLMLMPQAWGAKYHLGRDVRAFFEYHAALMEPWDGPAAVVFSDGVNAGAMLDRNGLRPARYVLTRDNTFILASEAGVADIPLADVVRRGRLKPGEMIWCDLENRRLVFDREIKETLARRKPYRRWVEENRIAVRGLFDSVAPPVPAEDLARRQRLFHWSREDVEYIVKPMAASGHEPVGSMGNDCALAIFSGQKPLLYNYFKQHFAQVTNPPIDPIREELVMSLMTFIGNRGNILEETAEHARLVKLPRPILTDGDVASLTRMDESGFTAAVLPMVWRDDLREALEKLSAEAVDKAKNGVRILILSDRDTPKGRLPIPALLALGAVNQALIREGLRPQTGLVVQSGEVREVMHFALLLGFGATAVHPYLALECVATLSRDGELPQNPAAAVENYLHAVDKGLLKIMSKMGISTLRSYRGAQIFEAIGLGQEVMDAYFPGVPSRIGGLTLEDIARETAARCAAVDIDADGDGDASGPLRSGGEYAYRKDGEKRLWTPTTLGLFRQAVRENNPEKYKEYAKHINEQGDAPRTLRSVLAFKRRAPVPVEQVEGIDSILKRFVSGAMSLGSLSPEAHETIAVAMNRLGAMSNCGEGGEDPNRSLPGPNGENRASAIRQVASGRFGVTVDYLAGAREIQIKMAQGAKPGEGGQLPGHKVDSDIARVRHSTPGVTLISPPPHHDIYSIEDLAQLISDLRGVNPAARISVKLVSEAGVGTVAAGVAKAAADVVLISGYDGGTGASPLSSIKHAGLPWELGLAEAHQTLTLNRLRDRVRLQTDGQLKTGRDVVIAAMLGADEFGFATTLLVCMGCMMLRKCHNNGCAAGVATQDPDLRRHFSGRPEYIENFLRFVAAEAREILASLGLRTLGEAVGRSDLLEMNRSAGFAGGRSLDFRRLLESPPADAVSRRIARPEAAAFDRRELIPRLAVTLEQGESAELRLAIANADRSCGAALSGEIARRFGAVGLPEDAVVIHLEGCAGQSFGAFLAPGVTLNLAGEANDFVGKGLSGGKIIVRVPADAPFAPAENAVAGNVVGYGATSGKIFLNGLAGERFAIRNSGMTMVLEGGGDHGCEYMTGGLVAVLGAVGVNFGAGMSGGIAYVYDQLGDFDLKCNLDTVDLEYVEAGSRDEEELLVLIREHASVTGSARAADILDNWSETRSRFVKVFPIEYKRLLRGED